MENETEGMDALVTLAQEATAMSTMLAAMVWVEEHGDDHGQVKTFVLSHLHPLTLDDTESVRDGLRMVCREIAAEIDRRGLSDDFRAAVFGGIEVPA